jgi:hypothetical protein
LVIGPSTTTTVSEPGAGVGVGVVRIIISVGSIVVALISGPISAVLEGVGVAEIPGVTLAGGDWSVSEGAIATWVFEEAVMLAMVPFPVG